MDERITTSFNIGDRVVAIYAVDGKESLIGMAGTVVDISKYTPPIGVEFDHKFPGGHDCDGRGKYGYCRYGAEDVFKLESLADVDIAPDEEELEIFNNFLASYQK